MGVKTAGVGHFTIPTAPAAGASVTSGAANTFTTTPIQLIASTAAALYITGVHLEAAAAKAATYIVVQLMIGAAAAETIVGQYLCPLSTASTVALGYRQIYPPIPVASGIRISAKTADSVGAAATLVTLECIAQSNVVDDGITVGTVALVNTLTTYTGNTVQTGDSFARLGAPVGASHSVDTAAVKTDTAAIKLKTDNLPAAPASTTNITAGTITTVTNLTNAATAGDLTATMKTSVTTAATAATPTAASVTGAVGSVTGSVGSVVGAVGSVTGAVGSVTGNVGGNVTGSVASVVGAVGSVTGLTASRLDVAVSTLATAANLATVAGYLDTEIAAIQAKTDNLPSLPASAGDVTTVGTAVGAVKTVVDAVKVKTDQLSFTVANKVDANAKAVNDVTVSGAGTALNPWGP